MEGNHPAGLEEKPEFKRADGALLRQPHCWRTQRTEQREYFDYLIDIKSRLLFLLNEKEVIGNFLNKIVL